MSHRNTKKAFTGYTKQQNTQGKILSSVGISCKVCQVLLKRESQFTRNIRERNNCVKKKRENKGFLGTLIGEPMFLEFFL